MTEREDFFCSWSGGKDSCLSLYKAMSCGLHPKFLLCMCVENGHRTRSHGLSTSIIMEQAKSVGVALLTQSTSWQDYRQNFFDKIQEMKRHGVSIGVFGDIDLEEHIKWEQELCNDAGIKSYLPLIGKTRKSIIDEFLSLGFQAKIVAIDSKKLNKKYLGALLTNKLLDEFELLGVDRCGENGEYHTVVVDGPIFTKPLQLTAGAQVLRSGHWFQDFFSQTCRADN
jgi:diphthine-ammonia ligase